MISSLNVFGWLKLKSVCVILHVVQQIHLAETIALMEG